MSNEHDGADHDDARLVALLDGELDDEARAALEARLNAEPDLRARLRQFRDSERPFASAFRPLLDQAPVDRLSASLAGLDKAPGVVRSRSARMLAAGLAAVLLFAVGMGVGRLATFGPTPAPQAALQGEKDENWRQAVAEYMSLYTTETLSLAGSSASAQVSAVGDRLGLTLTPERVALADLQLAGAQIFTFHGSPLGEIGYIDRVAGPVLFCIIADGKGDTPMKAAVRDQFAAASWARGGRGYLLIGRLPLDRVVALADSLASRF